MKLSSGNFLNDIKNWINSFINEKKVLGSSNNTIIQYTHILERFYEYCAKFDDMSIDEINRQFITSYIIYRENSLKKMADSTKSINIIVIKSFLKYITENNDEQIDLTKNLDKIKIKLKSKEPKHFTDKEVEKIIIFLNSYVKSNKLLSNRNSLIIKMFLYTGIRAFEILDFKISDLDYLEEFDVYKYKLIGKGNKERIVYIKPSIIEYELENLKKMGIDKIAITSKDRLMDKREIYSIVERILKKAGIRKKGLHIFRHTFAMRLVKNNVNLSTIKEFLGHSDIKTTMIYARTTEENKITAIKDLV